MFQKLELEGVTITTNHLKDRMKIVTYVNNIFIQSFSEEPSF